MSDSLSIDRSPGKVLLAVVNYNQEREIGGFLRHLREFFPVHDTIVIDDGSQDASVKIARDEGYTVIIHARNLGVGAAIRSGITRAEGLGYSAVAIMSSNGKMRPEDLARIIHPTLSGEVDYTTGSRFLPGGGSPGLSTFRCIAIPIFSFFAWPFLGRRFSDITCGFRCYSLALFSDSRVNIRQEWLNRYEMEYYIHYWACALGFRIREVPVTIPYDHLEAQRYSKIRPIVGWWSMVRPLIFLKFGIKR